MSQGHLGFTSLFSECSTIRQSVCKCTMHYYSSVLIINPHLDLSASSTTGFLLNKGKMYNLTTTTKEMKRQSRMSRIVQSRGVNCDRPLLCVSSSLLLHVQFPMVSISCLISFVQKFSMRMLGLNTASRVLSK